MFDDDFAVLKLGCEKANCFLEDCIHIFGSQLWPRRPNGFQELRDDGIQPVDFGTGDLDRMFKFLPCALVQLLHSALHQLQVNVQRIQWIPDLVRDACCKQRQCVQSLRLNRFLGCAAARSDIAQDHYMANLLHSCCQGG